MNNNMNDTSSKKQGKASTSNNNATSDYKYSPRVETPNPKATNKTTKKESN